MSFDCAIKISSFSFDSPPTPLLAVGLNAGDNFDDSDGAL